MNLLSKFKSKEILIWAGSILAGMFLGVFIVYKIVDYIANRPYQKPKMWILSQSLENTLIKQELLRNAVNDGRLTLGDLAKVATSSTFKDGEAIKIGNKFFLSTGSNGQIRLELEPGEYKISLATMPGTDFTGVPTKIIVGKGPIALKIGLKQGNERVYGTKNIPTSATSDIQSIQPQLYFSLYHDKDGNGEKGELEPQLFWSGVVLSLEKQD